MDEKYSVWDHVIDLRNLVIKVIGGWLIASLATVYYSDQIFDFITKPLDGAVLYFFSPIDPVMFLIKTHLLLGFLLAFPLIIWFLWSYLIDMFEGASRKYINKLVPLSLMLAYVGLIYGYFILIPSSVEILMGIRPKNTEFNISAEQYISFVLGLLSIMIIIFQVPLVIFSTIKANLIKADFYSAKRREIYFGFLVGTAILTPTPDIFTLVLVLIPMLVMFELALFFGKL
jgi:sec-independent protein translocase protein TatC